MEVKKGYKQTEVGVIPEDWDVNNLIDNSTLKARIGWQGLTTAEYLDNGEYYLVTGTDFADGRIKWDTCHYVEKERYSQDKNIQLQNEDIVITKDGTIGKVAYIDGLTLNATLNSGVFVVRPKNKSYTPLFLYYVFYSIYFSEFLRKLVAGSTISHLYQKDFVSFKFPLPPTKAEQTAIATALSDADTLIKSMEKLIAKKRLIKHGAMQELLKPKDGWMVKKLGEIFSITAGGDLRKDEFSSVNDERYCYPIYSNALTNAGLYGYCGTVGFANSRDHKFSAIGRLLILKPIEKLNCIFIAEYINLKIEFANESTGVPQLTAPQISKYEVVIPDSTEQTRIATILSDMDAEISALESKLAKYKQVKQGMMQELLTGRIRLV